MKIVLLGGGSSVGKTTLARKLARRMDGDHLQVDDLRSGVDDPRFRSTAATSGGGAGIDCAAPVA